MSAVDVTISTRFEAATDYVQAYDVTAWADASGHAWDRLAAIAGEFQRREYGWDRARVLLDSTRADVLAGADQ